jgi:Apea-like HEPN
MHEGAAKRLHELAKDVFDGMVIGEKSTVDMGKSYTAFQGLGEFLAKNMGEWIQDDYAWLYGYVSVRIVLRDGQYLKKIGPLQDITTDSERNALAHKVTDYWSGVPHSYTFAFPLPGISLSDPVAVCSGITLENVLQNEVDGEAMELTSKLSDLAGLSQAALCPSLKVRTAGLIELGESTEIPAAAAIRLAKIVNQLARVEGTFIDGARASQSPKFAKYTAGEGIPVMQNVTLPPAFASALPKNSLKQASVGLAIGDIKLVSAHFARIGQVIQFDSKRRGAKQAPNNNPDALKQYHLIQHCARIATATEWLFDAVNESASAIAFVQVAIGFEALYGGDINDPIKKTLSNRVAYSLGTSPGEREQLADEFEKFYDTRSKVVHTGASRLNVDQRKQFEFGKHVLNRCLQHELSLIPAVKSPLSGALAQLALDNKKGPTP